jgi:ketosteroid isomerase-like protein
MTQAEFEALLGRFTAAVQGDNGGGGAALAAEFTEDGLYHDVFYGPCQGRAKIAKMLEDHFWAHGETYHWEMHQPVISSDIGYAHWTFSFTSKLATVAGKRVVWEGMSKFQLKGGLIAHYKEMFDIGIALTQTEFPADRIARIASKHVERLRASYAGTLHLPGETHQTH